LAIEHPEYSRLLSLAHLIAHVSGARLGLLPVGANALGLSFFGGESAEAENINANAKVHLLWGIDPALDCIQAPSILQVLDNADCVIAATAFRSPMLDQLAHIYLPVAAFYESGGTFMNMEGRAQTAKPSAPPLDEAKPGWKILRVAGNLWGLPDPGFETLNAVSDAAKAQIAKVGGIETLNSDDWNCPKALSTTEQAPGYIHIAPLGAYRTDPLTREAEALQKTNASAAPVARLHPEAVEALGLEAGDFIQITANESTFDCAYQGDPKVPKGSLVLNAGFDHSALFMPYEVLTVERAVWI
jgi:NADH-quinone oxidoreductase subunit G